MILPQNVGLASWAKLREEKELSSLDVILIKEKASQEKKKMILGRKKKIENANQTILTLLSQNLIESIFSHSFLRAKIRRTALGKDIIQLISLKFSCCIIFSKIPAKFGGVHQAPGLHLSSPALQYWAAEEKWTSLISEHEG